MFRRLSPRKEKINDPKIRDTQEIPFLATLTGPNLDLAPKTSTVVAPAYLRLKAAAAYVGMSEQMLIKLQRAGQGPPRITKGRCVLYSVRSLQQWMDNDEEVAS